MFESGDMVLWKKWIGKVLFYYPRNKTVDVMLYHYRGFEKVVKQIDAKELCMYEQICI